MRHLLRMVKKFKNCLVNVFKKRFCFLTKMFATQRVEEKIQSMIQILQYLGDRIQETHC